MNIISTAILTLFGLGMSGYALGIHVLNSNLTSNAKVPSQVNLIGVAGLGLLVLPWVL